MTGDITRSTFNPKKGYTSVRMQQGRLQLDADWNEQADIHTHQRRLYLTDMIGSSCGAPRVDPFTGKETTANFQLFLVGTHATIAECAHFDLAVMPGHYYVNGVLCECYPGSLIEAKVIARNQIQIAHGLTIDNRRIREGDWLVPEDPKKIPDAGGETKDVVKGFYVEHVDPKQCVLTVICYPDLVPENDPKKNDLQLRRLLTYSTQPDLPLADSEVLDRKLLDKTKRNFNVFLDVWERHLTAIDDPSIREVALNVVDTTTRTKTVWQLRLTPQPLLCTAAAAVGLLLLLDHLHL